MSSDDGEPHQKRSEVDDDDDEYEKTRQHAGEIVTMIDEVRASLSDHVGLLRSRTLNDLFANRDDLEAMRATASQAKKVLRGSGRFLVDDVTSSLQALRESLAEYSKMVVEKLREEGRTVAQGESDTRTGSGQAVRQATRAHEEMARLAIELKELEQYAAEIEEAVNREVQEGEVAAVDADNADRDLDKSPDHDQDNQESARETDEERRVREEEEERLASEKKENERRQAEEEEQKRRDEQRRKEEEELRRQEEEERMKKEDPKNWEAIVYELNEDDDQLGSGIACVVRAPPEDVSLGRDQLQCTGVNWRENRYPITENEEVVSTVIFLKPTSGVDMHFEKNVWIALPYGGTSRGRETIIRVQPVMTSARSPSPVDKQDSEKPEGEGETPSSAPVAEVAPEPVEWNDVMTRDTTVEGQENVRFVETPVKQINGNGIHLVVLTRPKRDVEQFNNRGGRLASSIDARVSISAPKNAFRLTTDVSVQVITVDSSTMSSLKERYDGCETLLGVSPIVGIAASNKPQKPLVVTVTNPSGGTKKSKTPGGAGKGGTSLPKTGTTKSPGAGGRTDEIDDVIQLVVKDSLGKWRHRDNVKLEQQRDCVEFQLNELVQRLILLRTHPAVEPADLCRMAGNLEASLIERPAQLVVRQREDDPSSVYVELCRRDAVDRLVNGERLRSLGYTAGPDPSRLVCLREGDLVEMSFRDNIEPIEISEDGASTPAESVRRFIFNSNVLSINTQMTVREKSSFAQNALDEYRGYIRLSLVERPYVPPPKVAGPSGISAVAAATKANGGAPGPTTGAGAANKKTATQNAAAAKAAPAAAADRNLICEIALTLPKPQKQVTKINRIDFAISPNGPLTSEYYDQLSEYLGDEWVRLAGKLGLSQPAIQRIIRNHAHLDSTTESVRRSAREALVQWHRVSTKSLGKVEELRQALIDAGRNDLAEELHAKNKDFRRDLDKKHVEERLRKSLKVFTDSVPAVRAWREIGRDLGLTADELEAIGGPAAEIKRPSNSKSKNVVAVDVAEVRNHAEKMLNKWIESNGEDATTDELIAALKKRKLNDTADSMLVIK